MLEYSVKKQINQGKNSSKSRLLATLCRPIINKISRLLGLPSIDYLEAKLYQKTEELEKISAHQKAIYKVISKIRASLDLETIFRTTTKETCRLLGVERVSVYRFSEDWGGEFIADFEFAEVGWDDYSELGKNVVWNDSYLQEHQGGRYRSNETFVVQDIYTAKLSQCHLEILEQFQIRAFATAPIFVKQKLWGILGAYKHSRPHNWQITEVKFLTQVSAQLGIALQQAEQLAEVEQKAKYLRETGEQETILFNLISEIRESLDFDTLFKTTAKEVRKALQCDRVALFRFDPDSNYCFGEFVAESVLPAYNSALLKKVRDNCFAQQYAIDYQQGSMQVLTDINNAGLKDCQIQVLEQFQIRAQITVPLMNNSKLWGLLCIHQCGNIREWSQHEIRFVKQLAAQFSVALEHSHLLAQTRSQTDELSQALDGLQEANIQLEQRAEYLQETGQQEIILFNLISEIRESLDFDILFKTTAKEVRKALQCDRVALFRFDRDSNYYSGEFVAESVLLGYDSALSRKVKDYCFAEKYTKQYQQGSMEAFSDIDNAGLTDCYIEMLKEFQIRAQIIVPLIMGSTLWGLLCIHQCQNTREWTNNEIQFVKQLAAQFSVALEHSHLLAQTRSQAEELSQALDALQEANHKLENLAKLDGLTQIPNRRYLDEFLDREWRRLLRENQFLSLIMFDVDRFKLYNDFYGHQAGDECLVKIAQTAKEILKRPVDLLARYGGEEFAVILPNTDKSGASVVAEQIQSAIRRLGIPHEKSEKQIVTLSLGVATEIPSVYQTPQKLILKADQALYQAKQKGRDCSVHFRAIEKDVDC